ncbi:hypothetical protein HPP92_015196 [Vanilla planifolia]|uniref:DUF7806 domain-containing protein n=1 Tax=Vanilla planifolia TaxID=51239 RepID=A0A835UWZ7_VANPL|nr:hypothetical protein HPP92_015196 [Vanilla planifolia]
MMESHKEDMLVPNCCRRTKADFGFESGKSYSPCAFHTLVELLVGMKFSVEHHSEGLCVTVTHQMSGYSFTLSWVRDKEEAEQELVYQVFSLGTIEGIAKQWMKEDIVFSLAMCPVFFDRLSKVLVFNK